MTDQATRFPTPRPPAPTWTLTAVKAYLYFDIDGAPDIQDGHTSRRRITRPTQAEVLTTGRTVEAVWLHGRAVRRNGTLGAPRTHSFSARTGPRNAEPSWLVDLLHQHGLTLPRST